MTTKYAYDKAARTIRIVPSVDLTRDVVTVEIPGLTMMEMGWTTISDIDKALVRKQPTLADPYPGHRIASPPTRVVISPPSPCRAPAEPLTAGQRMQAEGVQRAVARLNSGGDAFMPGAARWLP